MKEDLIKVLNFKLKQIKDNIENLNDLNHKIEDESEELRYTEDAINVFKSEEHGFDIYKFSNIDRETFNKLLMNLSDEVLTKFGTNSCNYEGLIYLINGINNGISLTLTQEQMDAINLFIDKLLEKAKEQKDIIEKLNDDKQKLDIKELDVLEELENKYSLIIDNIEDKKYVTEIDEVVEAINYSEISKENVFNILCYLLKYNSDIYLENKINEVKKEETVVEEKNEIDNESIDLTKPFEINEETSDFQEEVSEENEEESHDEFSKDLESEQYTEVPLEDNDVNEESFEMEQQEIVEASNEFDEKVIETEEEEVNNNEYNPILPPVENEGYYVPELEINNLDGLDIDNKPIDIIMPSVELDLPTDDDYEDNTDFDTISLSINDEDEKEQNIVEDEQVNIVSIPNDFEIEENEVSEDNIEEENDENIEIAINEDVKEESQIDELNVLFDSYDFNISDIDDVTKSMLLKGNILEYKNVINKLNSLGLLKYLKNNISLLVQILLYSNENIIDSIIEIVENNLSVDKDDREITLEIILKTMPSIFVKGENGNYDNFIKNIELMKKYGIDLINLFDFSREVLITDSEIIANNYEIIRSYDLTVNAYNAKYLLLLPNIANKINLYVESMYKDNSENGNHVMFDGLEMIKLYPSKLNTVTTETLERLRYSSENNLKVFGTKEKSLAGEITNLDVNIINISEEFKKSLFNNEFDIIARDEVERFIKLVSTNERVDMNEDELLSKLNGYRIGLRYFIGNINVSANKVIRNYNILVNNNVDKTKALLFAICYNLVITKTEYERLKSFVNGLGGN